MPEISATLETALNQARSLLNDDTIQTFTDAVLTPKLQIAHQELQTALWDAGSPIIRKLSASIVIPINTLSMITLGTLPSDFLVPFKLYESPNNNGPWTPMTEVYFISDLLSQNPPVAQTTTLKWWSWIGDDIVFLGSTAQVYIQILYRRQIPIPSASGDLLGMPYAEMYLAPRTAGLAGGALGSAGSLDILTKMSEANLAKVIIANRGKQPIK